MVIRYALNAARLVTVHTLDLVTGVLKITANALADWEV